MPNAIMTVKELALYLRLHESSVYRMCQAGSMPAYKVGRSLRFRKEEIDAWLAQTQMKNEPLGDNDVS